MCSTWFRKACLYNVILWNKEELVACIADPEKCLKPINMNFYDERIQYFYSIKYRFFSVKFSLFLSSNAFYFKTGFERSTSKSTMLLRTS